MVYRSHETLFQIETGIWKHIPFKMLKLVRKTAKDELKEGKKTLHQTLTHTHTSKWLIYLSRIVQMERTITYSEKPQICNAQNYKILWRTFYSAFS